MTLQDVCTTHQDSFRLVQNLLRLFKTYETFEILPHAFETYQRLLQTRQNLSELENFIMNPSWHGLLSRAHFHNSSSSLRSVWWVSRVHLDRSWLTQLLQIRGHEYAWRRRKHVSSVSEGGSSEWNDFPNQHTYPIRINLHLFLSTFGDIK